ncbi:ABC transporter ATP-binding protein [Geomicrobium sp. JCM 19038]|uniref:ABC transporter ATP-binding protein n=1 Tax=Geomicrobium sp. JCM 19038 TaxID=1460635 RepID=UPI00045F2F93|nr:ABC transporter ATP-binding protein [Geomicrobium sp. JCM 19038]GAK06841.1 putrescine transport ATP-binding protein PotA [Geomicrobium sp. JCM 19038]
MDLNIREGEFYALLGPSGCGKTTTMRCIAGFEDITEGDIYIGEQRVNDVAANRRNCGMVFQSYALFPHYNVFENVAYSLTVRDLYRGSYGKRVKSFARLMSRKLGKPPKELYQKVMDALQTVELNHLAERGVGELSGGQQQRVALARALVMEPAVLLMDEPLSNLDKKLRNTMRTTIRNIQQEIGITTIFVTHDQEEAMSMADRIAVMKDGEIVQQATPTELYGKPLTPFVADFVGSSNLYDATVIGERQVKINDQFVVHTNGVTASNEAKVLIRPEGIKILRERHESTNVIEGQVTMSTYFGPNIRYDVNVGEATVVVEQEFEPGIPVYDQGDHLFLHIPEERVLLL